MSPEDPFLQSTPLKITDTTLRDGHQSLLATRMRVDDMQPIAEGLDKIGFYSIEVWGGATFDVATRFLNEDPWERVRTMKKWMPNTPFQMLLRGQNLVGYRHYPDDVVRAFVHQSAEVGIDIFRVFDAVNDERNFETAFKAIKESGKHIQGAISYSITERRLGGPVYNIDYFVKKALLLEEMGADSICLKDMGGLLAPYDAYELVRALKEVLSVPLQLHTHYTSGMASMSCLKAVEAGVDIIDCALAPFALRSSQPAVEPFLATLYGTPRDPGLDLPQLLKLGDMVEAIAPLYRDFLDTTKLAVIDTGVLAHQTPGGMMSNLVAQLREAGALDRIQEVYEELPRTRKDLGYPPLVTPTSQIVGVQAVQNVLFGRYTLVSGQVKDYVYGLYGKPPMPIDPEVQKIALKGYERGEEPITCRPADILDPEMELAADATKEISQTLEDQLIYALYPTTGMRFLRWKYNLEPAPDDVKPKTMEDVKREEELVAKARAGLMVNAPNNEDAPPKGSGSRTFHVYVGEEYYKVDVEAANGRPVVTGISPARRQPAPTRQAAPEPRPRAGSQPPVTTTQSTSVTLKDGEVAIEAPMPGIVIKFTAEVGATVKAGDTVVILEAMKMQQSLASPIDGVVKSLDAEPGSRVVRAQVLAVISRAT